MTAAIVSLLIALTVAAWVGVGLLKLILSELEGHTRMMGDIRKFQLNPRTRIGGKLNVQTGPPTEEQSLVRLGRASAARRVVVGGDPDSSLYESLNRSLRGENQDD